MVKKDFVAIAAIIAKAREKKQGIPTVERALAQYFKSTNDLFKENLFIEACHKKTEVK